jgi:hypothetical protein
MECVKRNAINPYHIKGSGSKVFAMAGEHFLARIPRPKSAMVVSVGSVAIGKVLMTKYQKLAYSVPALAPIDRV